MLKGIRWISGVLILALVFSLLPVGVVTAATEEKAVGRAVSISSVSVPAYDGGKSSSWMTYDCGAGVTLTDASTESKMCIVSNTNKTEFNDYVTKLQDQGYTKIFARKLTGVTKENIFGKFLSSDGSHSVYIALFPYLNQVRIVVDNNTGTVGRYSYTGIGTSRTELYLYSLSQPHDGWGSGSDASMITQYRSGAGSMLFFKMSDNSLYIIDGGSGNQMGDRACEELYAFLRSVTGIPEGQRMTINTWHISHPHSDHITGFTRFLNKYHEDFDLLTVLYNFDIESISRSFLQAVAKLYPDVGYYKPHTGDQYSVSGITFDVLYTTEDRYQPNSSNKLILGDSSCIAYTHENNTSLVVQVRMDGKKILLTGDLQKADATLMAMYPASVLQSDVLQIPHHGIDNHTTLAKTVAPAIGFTNQSKKAVMSRELYYNNNSGWYPYIGQIYYAGTETVGYAADSGVFYRKAFEGYDNLKWSDYVYELGKSNPQNGENAVKDPETYYRYTQATEITTSNRPYIIVDDKLGRVLSYDAIGDGGVTDALPAFYDGTHYYFSDSQRRLVNWLIKYTTAGTVSDRAVSSAVTTYYERVMIKKWSDDYWGTPTKNHAITIGKDDTFTSEGMFDTWASFSQQFYTSSNYTWIDKLSDNSFVIYRNDNGTYYPLYRDGNIATERGWGISKLSQSKINSMRKYVKTRLYSYEETPSNMLLSWTGHKDYYVRTGISETDLINMLISDIRVNYSFDTFDGTGEIFHTSQNKKNAGTYWFTYSPAYDPNVARDYTATINYRSANGTVLSLGSFTVHTAERPAEETQALYFGFDDSTADRNRYYFQEQYGATNFDGSSRWVFTEQNLSTGKTVSASGFVNKAEGNLVYRIPTAASSYSAQTYCLGNTPLNYDPSYAQVAQIRFRLDNLKNTSTEQGSLRLWYIGSDGVPIQGKEAVISFDCGEFEEKYKTLTIPLESYTGEVKGVRLEFSVPALKDTAKEGAIYVDFLYTGPKAQAPEGRYTVTFQDADGSLLARQVVALGDPAIYEGPTPTKAPDETYHYSFSGWDLPLEGITADLTVTATYRADAHSYVYSTIDALTHRASCSLCQVASLAPHVFTEGLCLCGEAEHKEPLLDPALKLGHSLNLASDISMNFAVAKSLLADFDMDTVYVESALDIYEGSRKVGTEVFRLEPVQKGNYYYFTLTGITAVQMNDGITSVLYGTKAGQPYCSPTDEYSVATYAYAQLSKNNAGDKLKQLCADLLRYGAMTQTFKDYRTDHLADEYMTQEQKAYLSSLNAVAFGNLNSVGADLAAPTVTWAGKALDLASKVTVKYIFDPSAYPGQVKDLSLHVAYLDVEDVVREAVISQSEVYDSARGLYVFSFDGLLAAELRTAISARIYAGTTPVSQVLRYSPDTYGNNKTGALGELCKALFAYSDSAKAYLTN